MLNHLKKFFNQEEEQVAMTTETTQAAPVADAMAAELSELKANFAQVSEELTATKDELSKAMAALTDATAALDAAAAEKAQAEAAAAAAKLDARRKEVEAVMGTEKADAFMAATEHMDDTTFKSLCGVFATNAAAEANSEMFTEVGVETKADAQDEPKVEHFNKYLPKKSAKKESK